MASAFLCSFPNISLKTHDSFSVLRLSHSDSFYHFPPLLLFLCRPLCLSLPLSFPEMLPCRWAIRSDHYFEAQTGCLDTGLGDELSRRAGSSSSSSSSQDGAVGPRLPLILTSALRITLLFCALLRMTKVPCRQTPVKNISIHGFRPVKDEELHFDTESRLKGSVSV